MKKTICAIALAAVLLLTASCTAQLPINYKDIKSAKDAYEELDSARVVMTDLSTGERLMTFLFYINSEDEMILYYEGESEDGAEYAYSDGAEFFYKTADAEEWSVISSSDESYIYNVYSRSYRYPYADGGIFFLDGTSVADASATGGEDGPLVVTYVYDAELLNKNAAGSLDNVSSFSSLTAVYTIDDGCITEFEMRGSVTDSDGSDYEINTGICVCDMNETESIAAEISELWENAGY